MIVFTIGHSTRDLPAFIGLLQKAGADYVVDVRRFPHSRRVPQFNVETFPTALAQAGIGYAHAGALGGRRGERKDGKPSPHTLWREAAFRNYADYAETSDFQAAFNELLKIARTRRPAIMCAEAVWWKCHRRIITDYLLAAGAEVRHILADKTEPAHLTPGAEPQPGGTVLYKDYAQFL